jgi:hypothetical protein
MGSRLAAADMLEVDANADGAGEVAQAQGGRAPAAGLECEWFGAYTDVFSRLN